MKIPRDKTGAAPPGGMYRAIEAIAVLFLFLGGAAPVAAQGTRLFQIEDISGTVELGFLTDLEDRTRTSSIGSDFDRVELSQLLRLNTQGFIYHPRFLTFDGGFQIESIEGLAGESDNRLLLGGDWRFNFLESHPNSLSIYGRVSNSEFARPFSETFEVTDELYGVTFFQKWGWIPFDLSYQHRSRSGGVDDSLDNSADKAIFNGRYQIGERSDGKLDYDLAFEEIRGRNIRRQNLIATNLSHLGAGTDKRLRTDFRFNEERDGRQIYNITGRTDFDWEHTDDLQTRYVFDSRWSDFEIQSAINLNPSIFLRHQLYDSLETDLELYGRFEDATFRKREEFGTRIHENYLKQIGDWGRLSISVSPHVAIAYNRLSEKTAFVFDEQHVMNDNEQEVLGRADIIKSTIEVTNLDGSIRYDEGAGGDYTVEQVGGGIEIWLLLTPTSAILDGQLVLVDYEYELPGDSDTLSWGAGVHTHFLFLDHWGVFGRYDTIDFNVLSGDKDDLRFNDFNRYVAGMEFNWPWFAAKVEFEENDANLGPFRRYSGSASVFTDGTWSWNARLNTDYAHREQTDDVGETVDRFSVSGSASKRFFKRGLLEAEGSWLRARWSGESSGANDIDAVRLKLKYSWWYGKVEVKLETGFAQILRPTEDRSVYRADLRVRRVF